MQKIFRNPLFLVGVLVVLGIAGIGCNLWPAAKQNDTTQTALTPDNAGLGSQQTNTSIQGANGSIDPTSLGVSTEAPLVISEVTGETVKPEQVPITLYFWDEKGGKLVGEKREVAKVTGIARAAVEELIRGPAEGSTYVSAIPMGTSLLDINVRADGRCVVDLSPEFKANLAKTDSAENQAVYSIVNTLTEFPTIKEVEILVDSQVVPVLAGDQVSTPYLTRDESLIKK